tara:strand:- start:741 stop:4457 length:3717 start_codon:yes stop_codon:yes gene_type:complete
MAKFNDSDLGGSFADAQPNYDPNSRANKGNYNGGGGTVSGENIECDDGETVFQQFDTAYEAHVYAGTRATPAYQYTTGQLEYAKTCLKKTIEVEGYDIDNEFEEKHTITVEEVSFGETPSFDAVESSDAVFGEDRQDCGQGLRFRLDTEELGKGIFEALWNLPGGADQFDYFYGLGAMKLICQHEIPTLSELADHGCIAGYLIDFDYWYKIDKDIEDGDETYRANTYIKVMPSGEFEGNFAFADEEDVPIEECEEAYEVKDVVKLDINGIWVKERPPEGPLGAGGAGNGVTSPGDGPEDPSQGDKSCVIEHVGRNGYTITARTDQEPVTHSYDYGTVINPDVMTAQFEDGSFFYPPDDLAFIPVWDEICYIEGQVPKNITGSSQSGSPENSCPTDSSDPTRKETVLESQNADKIWDIDFFHGFICGTVIDELSGSVDEQDDCGFFRASMLNTLSEGEVPEYFRTTFGEVKKSQTYQAEVVAGKEPIVKMKDENNNEVDKVKVPVHIDCWDATIGSYKAAELNPSSDSINCHHCDCHTISGSTNITVNIPCDPCDRCGNGDGTMEEGADYDHFQNNCPQLYPDGVLEITCFGQTNCAEEDETHIDYFILDPEQAYNQEFGYSYRENGGSSWDYAYGYVGNAPVEYGEKETYRCIVSYSGGCLDGSDFMKNTPEFSGGSDLTATYRKVVSADKFNKCGDDRLPSLSYAGGDLLKVEGSIAGGGFNDLDFFPEAAIATKVDLNTLDGGLESYGLNLAQQVRINDILGQLYDTEAVIKKTQVETQKGLCGMGAKFRNRRDKTTDPIDYSVVCKWDQYIPSLYAEMYGTVNKEDYASLLKQFYDLLEEFGLTVADGKKILMSHFHGPGSYCKERMDRATRVPSINGQRITNGYDSFGFFGCRFVNPAGQGDDDLDDPEINCDGTGKATFQLDTCDGDNIGWTLVDSTEGCHGNCIPDAPTQADEGQIAQCKRYIEQGDVEPPKIILDCKDDSADCGSATFELQNKGGVIGANCDGFQAIIKLINLTDDPPRINIPTWEVVLSNCPFECGPKLPLAATPQEIEQFKRHQEDPDNNKPPEKFVNCESLSGGLDPDWKWVITDPCANEECTAEYPDGPSAREIELAQQGSIQRRTVKCFKGDEPDKDLGPSCIIKCEDKPTPKAYTSVQGRKCGEDLLGDYANKLIGYTEKDAQSRSSPVLFDNLIKPISPSELESGLNGGNRPQYEIVAHKELCSLKQYTFTLGD